MRNLFFSKKITSFFRWDARYFLLSVLLFLIEVTIVLSFSGGIIRSFVGDIIAVMLLYTFFRSIFHGSAKFLAIFAFVLSSGLELLQASEFFHSLQLSGIPRIVFGSTFDPFDILAYFMGLLICLFLDPFKK